MNNCQFCGVEITQTKGKREKKYCSSKCRVNDFLKRKKEAANAKPTEEGLKVNLLEPDQFVFPDGLDDIHPTHDIGGESGV